MRIRKIFKRVGYSFTTYEYLAEVDWETNVTKYGNEKMEDRYKTDVFPLEILETASNYKMFFDEIMDCDVQWWKDVLNEEIKITTMNSKFLYSFLKMKVKKVLTKIN